MIASKNALVMLNHSVKIGAWILDLRNQLFRFDS